MSDTYPIRIRLGYGRDMYPRRVRVSLLIWAGNSRTETFRPSRLDTAQPNWLTPPHGVQIRRPPATSLRPRRRRGAPATATKSCTRPPTTSPRVPRRRQRAAPATLRDPATASPGRLSARGVELWKTRMPDVLARDNGVASTAAAGWLGARQQQHLLCRPGSLPAPFPSFPLPFLSNFYQSLFPRRQ